MSFIRSRTIRICALFYFPLPRRRSHIHRPDRSLHAPCKHPSIFWLGMEQRKEFALGLGQRAVRRLAGLSQHITSSLQSCCQLVLKLVTNVPSTQQYSSSAPAASPWNPLSPSGIVLLVSRLPPRAHMVGLCAGHCHWSSPRSRLHGGLAGVFGICFESGVRAEVLDAHGVDGMMFTHETEVSRPFMQAFLNLRIW